jgi:CRP-like cAMP-binding protein
MPAVKLPVKAPVAANGLLAALPRRDFLRLLSGMELVTLSCGEVLLECGQPIAHVYFPNDAVISLISLVDGRLTVEVAPVGREGMLGISLALGGGVSSLRALVMIGGTAMRMEATPFLREFARCIPLQRELFRYTHMLMVKITQTTACSHFHTVGARLACRLLMIRDHLQSERFRITQECLAHMLGVRRVGVTNAAYALKQNKLINYSRGNIVILNRHGLENASCSCYRLADA